MIWTSTRIYRVFTYAFTRTSPFSVPNALYATNVRLLNSCDNRIHIFTIKIKYHYRGVYFKEFLKKICFHPKYFWFPIRLFFPEFSVKDLNNWKGGGIFNEIIYPCISNLRIYPSHSTFFTILRSTHRKKIF